MVQIAGVAPIMVYLADSDQVFTLTGVGPWPKGASLDRFVQEFGEVPIGILRPVVPAAPDANIQALGRWGTMTFGEVSSAAIRYAREGFPMHEMMRAYIEAFRGYVARKYGKRFNEFIGGRIEVQGVRKVKSWHEVKSMVYLRGEAPFEVSFLVSDRSGKDLFFDMIIEGISLRLSERTEIGAMLDRRNGDINALIEDIKRAG